MKKTVRKEIHQLCVSLQNEPDLLWCVEEDLTDLFNDFTKSNRLRFSRRDWLKAGFYLSIGWTFGVAIDKALGEKLGPTIKKWSHEHFKKDEEVKDYE